MLSKNQRKQILQLSQKKQRFTNGLFVAEGEKVIRELMNSSWVFESLYTTYSTFHPVAEVIRTEEMNQLTHFKTPSPVLGVFKIPPKKEILNESITIVLDGISDPGNLGTLIRLCDWYGLSELICSKTTVDCFNPKVIQASMGSIVRVHCQYVSDLAQTLKDLDKPIFGATARGNSLYDAILPKRASFVFGSESHGISYNLTAHLDEELAIPHFKLGENRAESLNVASAGAIFLSEIFRPS